MTTTRLWTIERRGEAFILMSWAADIAQGPNEVWRFASLDEARSAAEKTHGGTLAWREARGAEIKHGVIVAADV